MEPLMTEQETIRVLPLVAEAEEGALRAIGYRLLGALLARPADQAMLERLRAIESDSVDAPRDLAAGLATLRLAASHARPDDVEDEFNELFIGLGRGELVPFASWYQTGFLMEKPLAVLRNDLAALGFERQPGVTEPEDHVAALCEVMAMLADDPTVELAVQRGFFERHAASWMGRFFADLEVAGAARFYRAVGQFGTSFMALENRYFSLEV